MAWNEPGGGKDPWGNGGNRGNNDGNKGGNNQGPPDLDEALKQLLSKLNSMFGGKSGNGGSENKGNNQGAGGMIGILLQI